jgi:hypothetical protein
VNETNGYEDQREESASTISVFTDSIAVDTVFDQDVSENCDNYVFNLHHGPQIRSRPPLSVGA